MSYQGEKRDFWFKVIKDGIFSFGILSFLFAIILSLLIFFVFWSLDISKRMGMIFYLLLFGFFSFIICLGIYILIKSFIKRKIGQNLKSKSVNRKME